jgi:hypothetical protein
VVSRLKWEATPRQRWVETQATSLASAAASGPSSSQRVRSVTRRWPVTQARVMVVSPKVVGFRNDIGPCQAPLTASQAARWARPTRTSATPTR